MMLGAMPAGASRFWQGHPCRQGSSGPAKNKGRLNPQDPPRKSWHGNCEPNIRQVRTPGWLVDDSEDAAILLRGTPMRKWGKCRGFVWAQVTPCTIFSCYISPNITTMLREAPGRSCKLRADARRTGDGSRGFQRQNFHVGFYRGRRQGAHAGGLGCSDEPGRHEPRRAHVREGRKQVGSRRYILFARHRQTHTGMARDGSRDDYQRPPAHRIHDQSFPQFTGGRTSSAWMEMDRQQKGRADRAVEEGTRTSQLSFRS
jgi:hypothetical protein